MTQILVSKPIFSKQAKVLQQCMPSRPPIKLSEARALLSGLYGFDSDHHYQKCIHTQNHQPQANKLFIENNYGELVNRLATLAQVDGQVAKYIIRNLWPNYITKQISAWRQHKTRFILHGDLYKLFKKSTNKIIDYEYDGKPSVKDTIEAIGIPHTEIAVILKLGQVISFDNSIEPNQEYHVLPPGTEQEGKIFHAAKPSVMRFVLDVHLGKLANYLRMLGIDTMYFNEDKTDAYLADVSHSTHRILLTRDKGLLKRSIVMYGCWLRSSNPIDQLSEIITRYHLKSLVNPFARCIACNGHIIAVKKEDIVSQLPPLIAKDYEDFKQCDNCQKVYWKGSHFTHMENFIARF